MFDLNAIKTLDPTAQRFIAGIFSQLADLLIDHATQAEELAKHKKLRSIHRRATLEAIDIIALHVSQGRSQDQALSIAEKETGFPLNHLKKLWDGQNWRASKLKQNSRNPEIMKRAAKGWTNAKLAQHYELSESRIGQIISEGKQI